MTATWSCQRSGSPRHTHTGNERRTFASDVRPLYGHPLKLLHQREPHEILGEPVGKSGALVGHVAVARLLQLLQLLVLFGILVR